MALIKHSQNRSAVANAVILDLGDLARQGERLKERARAQADEIIAKAHEERNQIIEGADELGHKRGFERGLKKGIAEGTEQGHLEAREVTQAEFDTVSQRWLDAVNEFESVREQMIADAKREIVAFAEIVARRVTKRAIELDDRVVAAQLESTLRRVCKVSQLKISVSPSDEAIARETMPALVERLSQISHAELVVDPNLSDGSCVVRTDDGGEIDASIETQIDRVLSVLLPSNGKEPQA